MRSQISFCLAVAALAVYLSGCESVSVPQAPASTDATPQNQAPAASAPSAPQTSAPTSSAAPSPSPTVSGPTAYAFSGGDGSAASPFGIRTYTDLQHVKDSLASSYNLLEDVDCTGASLSPIGSVAAPFAGHFYGNSHAINNARIHVSDGSTAALFGAVTGTVQDVNLSGVDFQSSGLAAFIGYLNGSVTNINMGSVTAFAQGGAFTASGGYALYAQAGLSGMISYSQAYYSFNGTMVKRRWTMPGNVQGSVLP